MLKKILLEPLVHFLVLSALFFVVYDQLNPAVAEENIITVSQNRIQQLDKSFAKVWRRDPNQEELENMIRNFILEEVYNRQARALGLDLDDNVIRRRLHQKMEFMLEDVSGLITPPEEELKAYYQENVDKYLDEARYSFTQVYLNTNKSLQALDEQIALQKQAITEGKDPVGESSLLPETVKNLRSSDVRRQFGEEFSIELSKAESNDWFGPVQSGFGLHFIKITESTKEKAKNFEQVKSLVLENWQQQMSSSAKKQYEADLLEQYKVIIDMPETNSK